MVHLQRSILFPNLNFQSEAQFKSWNATESTQERQKDSISIYKLDWSTVDKIKEDRWLKQHANTSDSKFPGTLPQKYDQWVKDMHFAITNAYLTEIRRTARLTQTEWGTERKFDTMIREICLQPAVEYAYVAFRLLADCMYDPQTNYFYRGPDKVIAIQAMLYKFWSFQTGMGLVRSNAHFDKIEKQINKSVLLMNIECEKCGAKSFIGADSEGWKFNLNSIDVNCPCGHELIKTYRATASPTDEEKIIAMNSIINKYPVKDFIKDIDDYEKTMEPGIKKVAPLAPVKEVKFHNANESVMKDLKSNGYASSPKPLIVPSHGPEDFEIVRKIKTIRVSDDEKSETAFNDAYCNQVDLKTHKGFETADDMKEAIEKVSVKVYAGEIEKEAEDMFMANLKEGIKDLPESSGICQTDGLGKIKVLINGMPLIEIRSYNGMSEKEAIAMAMENKDIKKYTEGKVIGKSFYSPGYCLNMVFKRADKKQEKKKK